MKLKKSYTGVDYATIRWNVFQSVKTRSQTAYPWLSNGEVIAFAQAWRRAAARSSSPRWPAWYEIVLAALGWEKVGDRFDMSEAHAKRAAPPALVEQLWIATDELAVQLDTAHTVIKPLIVDYSRDAYAAAAREAWNIMKAEASIQPVDPFTDAQPISSPDQVDDATTTQPGSSGGGFGALLLLALLVAWAMKK
jgi:hypothetical protein